MICWSAIKKLISTVTVVSAAAWKNIHTQQIAVLKSCIPIVQLAIAELAVRRLQASEHHLIQAMVMFIEKLFREMER